MSLKIIAFRLTCFFAMSIAIHASAATDDQGWPSTVVKIEELRALTPFKLRVPALVAKGKVRGPATLRVHIASDGSVARIALLASCGNSDLDEASIHAMRETRFSPYIVGDGPIEVTLLVPVYVPKRFGRTD